jgi:small GTP-binding protein
MLDAFKERRMNVVRAVRELGSLADEIGARSVAQRVRERLVAKLEADRFNLVVVGEFNRGKTTLVNAVLGAQVLPVGVTPTTAVIHQIEYGDSPGATVEYESGKTVDLPFEEVRNFALGNPPPAEDPGPVKLLRVRYPTSILSDHIALIDTPGVNDLSLQRADITYSYIPQSDAVLFLLDAGQLLTASERVFLQEKLLGQSRDKIVFVVTKKDILSDSELDEAMAYARDNLHALLPSAPVFPVSAQLALEGREGSGLKELLDHLYRFLGEERGRIMLDNALGETASACAVLQKGLDAKRRGLDMSVEEVHRRIDAVEQDLAGQAKTTEQRRGAIREEVAAIKAWVRRDLERLVDDVTRQIPAIVDDASVDDLKSHLGPFLEKAFRDWATAETREIADALEGLAERTIALVREDARVAAKRLSETVGADIRPPAIAIDTFAYDVGVAALPIIGLTVMLSSLWLGALLIVAAPVLAIYMRGRIDTETRARARELGPKAVKDAADKVGPKLDDMIDEFGKRLDDWVVQASEEVYREILEVLSSARTELEKGTQARAPAVASCERQALALTALKARYERMRSDLWPQPADAQG